MGKTKGAAQINIHLEKHTQNRESKISENNVDVMAYYHIIKQSHN